MQKPTEYHGAPPPRTWRKPEYLGFLHKCFIFCLLISQAHAIYEGDDWKVFPNPHLEEGLVFEKMAVDPSTTRIFVGGVNHLYDISSADLSVRVHAVTGPEEDSYDCRGRNDACSVQRYKTNSYCKALAIDDKSSRLIECSNLYQGRCRLRNLHNITQALVESGDPLLSNDDNSSSVVFVGNGSDDIEGPVLYVASTYVNGKFRDEIPAVAARSLTEYFELAAKDIATSTAISVERKYRSTYRINYVNGFQVGDYAYFATRQGKTIAEDSQVQSRLIRVCTGDKKFYSYTEVPLECSTKDQDYNLLQDLYVGTAGYNLANSLGIAQGEQVLYGVFSASEPDSHRRESPSRKSAVCIYQMKKDVEAMFQTNIMNCYQGRVTKQLPWFKSADKCEETRLQWEFVKCGKDVNSVIGGGLPIKAKPVFTVDDARFTAIAVNTTHGNTVAFIGTDSGTLIKTLIINSTTAEQYGSEEVSHNEPILQDLEFSENGKHIYVLTPSKLVKLQTSTCDVNATTCGACLSKGDPYCGWCVRNNMCTEEDSCEKVVPRTSGWLSFQDNQCPNIKSVTPDRIQITTADFLNVSLENIEVAKTKYKCSFRFSNGRIVDTEPSYPANGNLRCSTPSLTKIPAIPANASYIDATLSIVPEGRTIPIASSKFSFYDCGRHATCSQCSTSKFPCDWCLESNECVAGKLTEDKCRKLHIVNGLKRDGPSRRKGPEWCPHIKLTKNKIYVAAGERKNISVNVQNLDPNYMTEFRCEFKIGNTVHEKLAKREGDNQITCEEMLFDYQGITATSGSTPIGFNVIWSSNEAPVSHVLDNEDGVSIEVYKCELLATNCGQCLTLDPANFECGWCGSENRCARPKSCKVKSSRDWLNSTMLCANPTITDFTPKKGPFGGKTRVRIMGTNLGRKFRDIQNAITIANVPCTVLRNGYQPASEIVCETGEDVMKSSKGPVVVRLKDRAEYVAISDLVFSYVHPNVSKISPDEGPRSGGTDVALFGHNLDAGSEVVVLFGNVPCEVRDRNASVLICRTMPSGELYGQLPLNISFDGSPTRNVLPISFNFKANPRFSRIDPDISIASGGIQIDVRGQGFTMLQRPYMVFLSDGDIDQPGPYCSIKDDSLMVCETPRLPASDRFLIAPTKPLKQSFAFDFDGSRTETRQIRVYPNPTVDQISETRFYRPGENSLTINGKDFNLGATERDIRITVGGVDCPLTALANKVVTCRPPSNKPSSVGGSTPQIDVKIGSLNFTAGELSYDAPGMPYGAIVPIFFLVFGLVALLIILTICYKKNTSSHRRQMKFLKNQMDTIEMKVATECKEAFAELQTSLNQYTADLPLGTPVVPFLEYKDYCARVLFPNNPLTHPVLHELEVESGRAGSVESGLREFHKLLMNKTFFLTMVRTMESNKYFLGKDRVYVGSLIMVVLQEKMGYCTEMLKQLLRELIEKTVEKKFQPKILFRRSESIAERMLAAWFTFLMHDYLRNYAGKRLYDLYWGIKQQMEKGPQDAATLEARYSLSEEKLLRATFEYRELTIFVANDSATYSYPDLPVKVLDCDTITQVKEKCLDAKYRTVRYSERPSANDLDLEWRTGPNGRQVLQDIDTTSKIEPGGWKKLNTLAHYNVTNHSVLILTARQNSLYNLVNFSVNTMSLLSDRSEKSSLSLKNSPTMNAEMGYKTYHLVKPTEHGPSESQEKMVTEIYLTRLLMMKGTLQKFINDLLEAIFSTSRSSPLPAAIKYMFDFMDEQALEHGISDPEVVHAWKSNALPLRFWVNLIKNPHFVFDIQKPTKVEGCLSVVAQTLMDACSTQDHQLTKDSPSSKLLFAKDMYQYRDWVDSYYTEISRMQPISDQDMSNLLLEESRNHRGQFHVYSALNELYKYLDQYKDSIMEALEQNDHAQASRLPGRLQEMLNVMELDCGRTEYDGSTLGLGYNSNSRLMPRERM
ncbi:unnamed protein product [Auanema sp. JU1783]|nr:unnamed protein product [Auanema sp. JU1783]